MKENIVSKITKFTDIDFGEIRTVIVNYQPWFVANDICKVLGMQNIRQNIANLSEDEKGVYKTYTPSGNQNMLYVNEPGLYHLVFTSRKPEAKKFAHWIYHEVLPTLRETGVSYKERDSILKMCSIAGKSYDESVYKELDEYTKETTGMYYHDLKPYNEFRELFTIVANKIVGCKNRDELTPQQALMVVSIENLVSGYIRSFIKEGKTVDEIEKFIYDSLINMLLKL